jgi:hypothetical protein
MKEKLEQLINIIYLNLMTRHLPHKVVTKHQINFITK